MREIKIFFLLLGLILIKCRPDVDAGEEEKCSANVNG